MQKGAILSANVLNTIKLVARGKALKGAAADLGVSIHTVNHRLMRAKKLVGADTIPHLIYILTKEGSI